jgi:hypothetical protein
MIRRSSARLSRLLGAAMTAAIVVGCGAAATATPIRSATPTASPSGTPAVSASASASALLSATATQSGSASPASSASGSAAPTATPYLGLPHVDAGLEDLLPSTIGGVTLEKFSLVLSAYIESTTGGDRALYAPWLLKFGKTTDDVNMAVSADLSQPAQVNFVVHAIEVPGAAAATLSSSFADAARAAGWSVATHVNYLAGLTLLEITDPVTGSPGYVFARADVLYTIITDDQSLLNEAIIWMEAH